MDDAHDELAVLWAKPLPPVLERTSCKLCQEAVGNNVKHVHGFPAAAICAHLSVLLCSLARSFDPLPLPASLTT